jgi:hypothetical protein
MQKINSLLMLFFSFSHCGNARTKSRVAKAPKIKRAKAVPNSQIGKKAKYR